MAVSIYDEAIIAKFKKWIPEEKFYILKPNETSRLWGIKADTENDEPLTLPLVSISRDPSIGLDITARRTLSCDGVNLEGNKDLTIQLNAIPINLNYQIDIYTKEYKEGDEYIRSLIFNIINHPRMKVVIPYNDVQIKHICYLWLESEITDNSDIPEKKFPDQFTRWTLRVSIHDAFLFSAPVNENYKIIGAELEVKEKQPGEDIITVVSDFDEDDD